MESCIQNVSARAVMEGAHFECGENSMLIQITDPCNASFFSTDGFPTPKHTFKKVHRFQFFDCDNESHEIYGEFVISDEQALEIAMCLKYALEMKMNVVVHCHAGICRSGAVAEVGSIMGFKNFGGSETPNVLVKKKLLQVLGLSYDENAELKARYDKYAQATKFY